MPPESSYPPPVKPNLIIIGLGNPGDAYARTRHNAGFRALDILSTAFGEGKWMQKDKFLSDIQEARIVTVPVLLAKPQTFMNSSGEAVKKIVDFYKVNPQTQVLILCDDIDLPLGTVRLRQEGGPGTHNGLRSVALLYGEHYPRLRIGIGPKPPQGDLAAWVLSVPSEEEQKKLDDILATLPDIIRKFVLGETIAP